MRLSLNWGVGITLAYLAFAGGTLGFVAYAMTQPVDLVSADYYSRSLKQDDRMAAAARVAALGRDVGADFTPDHQALDLRVPPEVATMATGTITWYRPSDSRDDRAEPFRPVDGHQRIPLAGLPRGHWVLQAEWQSAGQSFYFEQPVTVP